MMLARPFIAVALLIAMPVRAQDVATPHRLGVMAPMTGPATPSGRWVLQGIELAKSELKAQGFAEPAFDVEDDMCTAQGGLSAYQALRARGVTMILGPVCNAAAVPLLSLTQRDSVTLITTGIPSQVVLEGGSSVFTILPPIKTLASGIVDFAVRSENSNFAVLYTPDEFGEENFRSFSSRVTAQNGHIVHSEQFVPGSLDFKTFILKTKERGADAYLIAAYVGQYVAFLRQASQLDSRLPAFALPTFQSAEITALKPHPTFPVFYSYPGGNLDREVVSLRDQYLKTHPEEGTVVPMHVGSGRDAFLLLAKALRECRGPESSCIRQKIGETVRFSGMNGTISFDQSGNNQETSCLEIRQFIDGFYRGIGPITRSTVVSVP